MFWGSYTNCTLNNNIFNHYHLEVDTIDRMGSPISDLDSPGAKKHKTKKVKMKKKKEKKSSKNRSPRVNNLYGGSNAAASLNNYESLSSDDGR